MNDKTTNRTRQLRLGQTKSEGLLWSILRAKQVCGLKFRRQHPIGPFFADFACVSKKLVVEVDGGYHDYVAEKDLEREAYLRQQGWDILRFSDEDVENDSESVAIGIAKHLGLEFEFAKRKGTGSGMKSNKAKRVRQQPNQPRNPSPAAPTLPKEGKVESIQINELDIQINRSSRRKSVGISVNRDGTVSVAAPVDCERSQIDEFVKSKSVWIYQKLGERELISSTEVPPKQFVDGSSFWFLGRTYRLLVCDKMPSEAEGQPVYLNQDRFLIHQDSINNARECFRRWYVENGLPIVKQLVERLGNRISVPTKIDIRDIGFRWGSCTKEGKILISWRSIKLPMDALEYVVAHEMVHLLHRKHDDDFWHQLYKVMPDYDDRKVWLAKNGEKFAAKF